MSYGLIDALHSDLTHFLEDLNEGSSKESLEDFSSLLISRADGLIKRLSTISDITDPLAPVALYLGHDFDDEALVEVTKDFIPVLEEIRSQIKSSLSDNGRLKPLLKVLTSTFSQSSERYFQYLDANLDFAKEMADELKAIDRNQFIERFGEEMLPVNQDVVPYDFQIRALEALVESVESERGLCVLATGLGKTLVIGLFAKWWFLNREESPFLLLAHQEHLLDRAHDEFEAVFGKGFKHQYFTGNRKDQIKEEVPTTFGTFTSILNSLDKFHPTQFGLVIVDEAHHGQAETFKKVIEYFTPEYRGAVTATPDRADFKNIRELFGKEVFSLPLEESLALGLLTPVVYCIETVSADQVKDIINQMDEREINEDNLFPIITSQEFARIINEKTASIERPRIKIFVNNKIEAEQLASQLTGAVAIHSDLPKKEQLHRLDLFNSGVANKLISIDMFNEGKDIPDANVIVFLRSTDSPNILFQQLGRGLRRFRGKASVLVLDFVANIERLEALNTLATCLEKYESDNSDLKISAGGATRNPSNKKIKTFTVENLGEVRKVIDVLRKIKRHIYRYSAEQLDEILKTFVIHRGLNPLSGLGFTWNKEVDFPEMHELKDRLLIPQLPSYGPLLYRYSNKKTDSSGVKLAAVELLLENDRDLIDRIQRITNITRELTGITIPLPKKITNQTVNTLEDACLAEIFKHKEQNEAAGEYIFKTFSPLLRVFSYALLREYPDSHLDPDDVIQEGNAILNEIIVSCIEDKVLRLRAEIGIELWNRLDLTVKRSVDRLGVAEFKDGTRTRWLNAVERYPEAEHEILAGKETFELPEHLSLNEEERTRKSLEYSKLFKPAAWPNNFRKAVSSLEGRLIKKDADGFPPMRSPTLIDDRNLIRDALIGEALGNEGKYSLREIERLVIQELIHKAIENIADEMYSAFTYREVATIIYKELLAYEQTEIAELFDTSEQRVSQIFKQAQAKFKRSHPHIKQKFIKAVMQYGPSNGSWDHDLDSYDQ